MKRIQDLMKNVFSCYGVHTAFYACASAGELEQFDGGLRKRIYEHWDPEILFRRFCSLRSGEINIAGDRFGCRYCFFLLPGENAGYAVVGPWLEQRAGAVDIDAVMERSSLPHHLRPEITSYLESVPLINAPTSWEAMLSAFENSLFGGKPAVLVTGDLDGGGMDKNNRYSPESKTDFSMGIIESRYENENDMLRAVSEGDTEKALYFLRRLRAYDWRRLPDKERDMKNHCIIFNSLMRKAVENGFVHPAHIDTVSAGFASRIEETQVTSDLIHLGEVILRRYCALVQEFSLRNFSPLIRKVINYIDFNMEEELSLSYLARHFSVSAGHLSALFKKEKEVTITAYILNRRLERAVSLLRGRTFYIQEVAEQCGFLDVNYFTRLFKRRYGQSPGSFRNALIGAR